MSYSEQASDLQTLSEYEVELARKPRHFESVKRRTVSSELFQSFQQRPSLVFSEITLILIDDPEANLDVLAALIRFAFHSDPEGIAIAAYEILDAEYSPIFPKDTSYTSSGEKASWANSKFACEQLVKLGITYERSASLQPALPIDDSISTELVVVPPKIGCTELGEVSRRAKQFARYYECETQVRVSSRESVDSDEAKGWDLLVPTYVLRRWDNWKDDDIYFWNSAMDLSDMSDDAPDFDIRAPNHAGRTDPWD